MLKFYHELVNRLLVQPCLSTNSASLNDNNINCFILCRYEVLIVSKLAIIFIIPYGHYNSRSQNKRKLIFKNIASFLGLNILSKTISLSRRSSISHTPYDLISNIDKREGEIFFKVFNSYFDFYKRSVFIALRMKMKYFQICNWFANWRRKLKNSCRSKEGSWGRLIKGYNNQAKGNVEQFSISSDDSIWEETAFSAGKYSNINRAIFEKKFLFSIGAFIYYSYLITIKPILNRVRTRFIQWVHQSKFQPPPGWI